jgi:hypothetical protein
LTYRDHTNFGDPLLCSTSLLAWIIR